MCDPHWAPLEQLGIPKSEHEPDLLVLARFIRCLPPPSAAPFAEGLADGGQALLLWLAVVDFLECDKPQAKAAFDALLRSTKISERSLRKWTKDRSLPKTRRPQATHLLEVLRLAVVLAKEPNDENRNVKGMSQSEVK